MLSSYSIRGDTGACLFGQNVFEYKGKWENLLDVSNNRYSVGQQGSGVSGKDLGVKLE